MVSDKKIFIPELTIYSVISKLINFIKLDLRSAKSEEDSYLYKILKGNKAGDYDFYEQAAELFSRGKDKPNALGVRLFFDAKRAEIPTIHILLPSESKGENGLGTDEGFAEPEFNDLEGTFTSYFTRRFQSNYQVVITSNNSLEVILLYHVLRSAVISSIPQFERLGISNLQLSGGDLSLNAEIVPQTVFVRGFNLNFSYDTSVPVLIPQNMITDIFFNGNISEDLELL